MSSKEPRPKEKDKSKVHKLSLKGSSRLVAEFVHSNAVSTLPRTSPRMCANFPTTTSPSMREYNDANFRARVSSVKKYGLNMLVSADDQVKAYIKKIMSQLDKWMVGGKISKLVIVITDKDTGEHVERWQFDVGHRVGLAAQKTILHSPPLSPSKPMANSETALDQVQISQPAAKSKSKAPAQPTDQENVAPAAAAAAPEKTEAEIQAEIAAIFRQITASVTFLPQLSGDCTFNVLVYADADSDVPVEWGDSDAKEIANGEHVQLRGFSTANHRVDTLVSYRLGD
ncbi:hypothetical protein MHUMG1_09885 [Metarhizium humberi]|uniref:HORMA domain-containing protein n=1 Tax=Metarhizium humberi TaxID=2596975 RepID=A0A9P8S3K9_9HYPO|nr:hypothetical protein MHUMG1_09885 [Metarhizium humberi]